VAVRWAQRWLAAGRCVVPVRLARVCGAWRVRYNNYEAVAAADAGPAATVVVGSGVRRHPVWQARCGPNATMPRRAAVSP